MNKKNIYLIAMACLTIILAFLILYNLKKSNELAINTSTGTIKISNIVKKPIETFSDSNIEYKKTSDYSLNYYQKNQLFIITLTNSDIKAARIKAEEDFLSTLKISKEQACSLNVQLGVPYSVNQSAAGVNYGLSFCPNGKPF